MTYLNDDSGRLSPAQQRLAADARARVEDDYLDRHAKVDGAEPNYGLNASLGRSGSPYNTVPPAPSARARLTELPDVALQLLKDLDVLDGQVRRIGERVAIDWPAEASGAREEPSFAGPIDSVNDMMREMSRRIYNMGALIDAINSRI